MNANPQRAEEIARKIAEHEGLTFIRHAGVGAFKHTFQVNTPAGDPVALKVYKAAALNERTEREIDAMRRCQHPSIAQLHSLGQFSDGGETFFYSVEEFLAGGSMTERLNTLGCLSAEAVFSIGCQLIDALAHIQALDLVHRDLKPDNIMFRDAAETAVIVDFGLVRDLQASSVTASWAMRGPGTPYFASPEQLNNEKHMIDWRSDQFGLGVTLSLALTGHHPYAEDSDSPEEVVNRVSERGPLAQSFQDRCHSQGWCTLLKMVQAWPVSRFRTPQLLRDAWTNERT